MSKRRWILSKDMRRCSDFRCSGYDKANAKAVVTNQAKGTVTVTCRECGRSDERQANKFKELRPCPRCKDIFNFTVQLWEMAKKDEITEHVRSHCSICELELSAASHYVQARAHATKAQKLREERARKKELRKRGTVEVLVADEISRGAAPVSPGGSAAMALATSTTVRELVATEKGEE